MYKHKLLIASSMIADPVFAGSVVFLFQHNKKGAQGVILNAKEVGKVGFGQMKDLFNSPPGTFSEAKEMILNGDLQSVPLFLGGPCHTSGIFFLHGHEDIQEQNKEQEPASEYDLGIPTSFSLFDEGEESAYQDDDVRSNDSGMNVTEGLYFGSPYTFGHLIKAGKLKENKFRFYTGLSIWSGGQLEYEVKNGAWSVVDASPDIFFDQEKLNKLAQSVVNKQPDSNPQASSKYPWLPKVPQGFDQSRN